MRVPRAARPRWGETGSEDGRHDDTRPWRENRRGAALRRCRRRARSGSASSSARRDKRSMQRGRQHRLSDVGIGSGYEDAAHSASAKRSKMASDRFTLIETAAARSFRHRRWTNRPHIEALALNCLRNWTARSFEPSITGTICESPSQRPAGSQISRKSSSASRRSGSAFVTSRLASRAAAMAGGGAVEKMKGGRAGSEFDGPVGSGDKCSGHTQAPCPPG